MIPEGKLQEIRQENQSQCAPQPALRVWEVLGVWGAAEELHMVASPAPDAADSAGGRGSGRGEAALGPELQKELLSRL